jgi:hypothetical protein
MKTEIRFGGNSSIDKYGQCTDVKNRDLFSLKNNKIRVQNLKVTGISTEK